MKFIHCINLPRHVCNHLFGKEHSHAHQMVAGAVVMACGVLIAHRLGRCDNELVAACGDAVGYGVHGLGLAPFIEYMLVAAE